MRDLIVETTSDLLVHRSSCDLSLDEIAATAGILRRHVTRYFATVDEILVVIAQAYVRALAYGTSIPHRRGAITEWASLPCPVRTEAPAVRVLVSSTVR